MVSLTSETLHPEYYLNTWCTLYLDIQQGLLQGMDFWQQSLESFFQKHFLPLSPTLSIIISRYLQFALIHY